MNKIYYPSLTLFINAIYRYENAIKLSPLNGKAYGYMGSSLFSLATLNESLSKPFLFHASKFIDASITMGFDPPSILHTRGSIALDIGDPELAAQFYLMALDKSSLSHGNAKDVPIEGIYLSNISIYLYIFLSV
jgi:hypothetical protein